MAITVASLYTFICIFSRSCNIWQEPYFPLINKGLLEHHGPQTALKAYIIIKAFSLNWSYLLSHRQEIGQKVITLWHHPMKSRKTAVVVAESDVQHLLLRLSAVQVNTTSRAPVYKCSSQVHIAWCLYITTRHKGFCRCL